MNFAIIAAGEGSRLRQEGVAVPKPLVDLDGRPMIRRLIDLFVGCGAESLSVIVNAEMTEVASYLRSIEGELPVPLKLVVKSTPSSLHSLWEVSKVFAPGTRCVVTTVDTIFRPADFARYVEAFEAERQADAFMAVTQYIDDEKPLYVETAGDMRVKAFLDSAPAGGARYVSGGIYGLGPRALALLEQSVEQGMSRMRNFQRHLVAQGLDVQTYDMGKIIDVDHQADIATARAFLSESPTK